MKKYNVYDTENEEYIMKDVEADAIGKRFNCTADKVYKNSYRGKKFENRYTVHSVKEIDEPKASMTPAQEKRFVEGWNEVRTASKLLKTGHGKFDIKNGKKCVVMK